MTTPNQTPNNEAYDPQQIGSDWNQNVTEESVKQWARDQVSPGFGTAFTGQFNLFNQIIGGIFNGWFGEGSVGDPLEVEYTVEAIKQAVINGWTIDTVPFSGSYEVPDAAELKCVLIGGGQNGQDGQRRAESTGGLGGGFIVETLDSTSLQGKTLNVVVGSSGQDTRVSDGSTVLAECTSGGAGGVSLGPEGYTSTASTPGNGGRGGRGRYYNGSTDEAATNPTTGEASAAAPGGAAGVTGRPGTAGSAGGNVSAGAQTKCGGGGGGGGGGGAPNIISDSYEGGPGGPGGYPGGGGGGGGGAAFWFINGWGIHGAGGIGAAGCVWFLWK